MKEKNKKQKISGWFIYWFGTSNKIPSDEMARIILIDQNRRPDRPDPIADFIEKYYISTLYLSDKIALASPRARRSFVYKSKISLNKNKDGYIISCGHNPMIMAEYRKDVSAPNKEYSTWFPK